MTQKQLRIAEWILLPPFCLSLIFATDSRSFIAIPGGVAGMILGVANLVVWFAWFRKRKSN